MGRLTQFVDELEYGFGWFSPEHPKLRMASHALLADGGVWLTDPSEGEGVEERVRALGEPAGVLQLLDRHNRACAAFAERLGVPHHRVPFEGVGPFETVPIVRRKRWLEVALWWPEQRVLVTADSLGTVPHYFALAGEPLGVHPLLRLTPPRQLAPLDPEHVLCGHGEGVHQRATEALRDALATSRRRLPRLAVELPGAFFPR
ncbi:MAG TPA: hypothetical protein VLK24_12025 [Gaiellaceae bacterium]|nr:hypothetical protein [Gaiellaceae bacterium]